MTSRPIAPVIPSAGRGQQRQHKPGASRPIRSREKCGIRYRCRASGQCQVPSRGGREAEDLVGEVWNACPAEKGGNSRGVSGGLRLSAACSRMTCRRVGGLRSSWSSRKSSGWTASRPSGLGAAAGSPLRSR